MKTFITGTYDTIEMNVTQNGAFHANTNLAPTWCSGGITSEQGLVLLKGIVNAH